jgi:hypothetical protein
VLSHDSAALLWGLPLLGQPATVHVIHSTNPHASSPPDVVRHVVALAPDDVTVRAGQIVTTLERTAVDCAASLGAAGGLVVMDAALHGGAVARPGGVRRRGEVRGTRGRRRRGPAREATSGRHRGDRMCAVRSRHQQQRPGMRRRSA